MTLLETYTGKKPLHHNRPQEKGLRIKNGAQGYSENTKVVYGIFSQKDKRCFQKGPVTAEKGYRRATWNRFVA